MAATWTGPAAMLTIFRKLFGSASCRRIIKQNNFTNFQHYFLQKVNILIILNNIKINIVYYNSDVSIDDLKIIFQTIPIAMAGLRNAHGICPEEVLNFLMDLFKYNDNSKNRYSDNYYRAALIEALGATVTPVISVQQG